MNRLIPRGSLDQYAAGSGVDRRTAGQNVVLTYVLKLLFDDSSSKRLAESLAFKGGTCLRKMFFGKPSRFSTDLDFTATRGSYDEIKAELGGLLNGRSFYDLDFRVNEWYDGEERTRDTCGARVGYRTELLQGEFKLQVSFRENRVKLIAVSCQVQRGRKQSAADGPPCPERPSLVRPAPPLPALP